MILAIYLLITGVTEPILVAWLLVRYIKSRERSSPINERNSQENEQQD